MEAIISMDIKHRRKVFWKGERNGQVIYCNSGIQ